MRGAIRIVGRFLLGAATIVLVSIVLFFGYLAYAPCAWRQPTLVAQAESVVAAIVAHRSRTGALPSPRADGMPDVEGVPTNYAGTYVVDADGQFTLQFLGPWSEGTMSFDGPWVRYASVTGRMECFAR